MAKDKKIALVGIDLKPEDFHRLKELSEFLKCDLPNTEWTAYNTISYLIFTAVEGQKKINAEKSKRGGVKMSAELLNADVLDALERLKERLAYDNISDTIKHIMRSNSMIN